MKRPAATRGRRWVPALLALYLALAVGYNLATPFGAPPDERPHSLYVDYLATQRSLPVLRREQRDAYEAHQPPLYYLLCLPVRWASRFLPEGNPSGIWAREKTLRLVSTLIGAVGLLLIGRLAAVLCPDGEALAIGATAFAAFLPMRLATAAAVGNDLLAELTFTTTLLLLALAIRAGITARRTLALGVTLGFGLLTKSTCLLLFPTAALGLALAVSRKEDLPQRRADRREGRTTLSPTWQFLAALVGAFAVALAVGGWWLARNQHLYGEVFVAHTFERYFQDTARPEFFLRRGLTFGQYLLFVVVPLTFESFWGVFGHMQIRMQPAWLYTFLLLPSLAAVGGLVGAYARREAMDRDARAIWGLLVVTWLLVAAAFLRFNTAFFQAQGRYLFPAMAPIALLFTLGLQSLGPARWRPGVALGMTVGMLLLALCALFACILPAFR
jgi:4-amino-4-deoxy-L-arabinose transferase-like glycosyltransferase